MLRVELQCELIVLMRLLELVQLEVPDGQVVCSLHIAAFTIALLCVVDSCVVITLPR